jgi:peptidoglycan/xylan/chitin deacetylase (PgdA/CDA1 family)
MYFPGKKMKALTFSYDDGVEQDRRLVELFNKNNLKCTFNLNSGLQSGASHWEYNGTAIRRMNVQGLKELYRGHEIAIHGLTHPRLEQQSTETILNEIVQDKINLERIFDCHIRGMAYPNGTYDDRVIKILKDLNVKYARTVECTEDFYIGQNLLELKPTCHHNSPKLMKLAEEFVNMKPTKPTIFYIWGHSYEFDVDNNWDMMERFCAFVSNRDDIYYGTNYQVLSVF